MFAEDWRSTVAFGFLLCVIGACTGTARESGPAVQPDANTQQGVSNDSPQGSIPSRTLPEADILAAAQQARQSFVTTAAPSVDVLMDEFLQALAKRDKDALTKLRVTRSEYTDLIIPGTVPVGKGLRSVSEQPKEYYWNLLDTKSHYYADNLVGLFGGRNYRSRELKFSRPTKEYAWYTAVGQVRLELAGDDDRTYHLLTGWLAEVDGKYKFISYEYND
jgi:hypothetical protein